jgi:hypothetical protein
MFSHRIERLLDAYFNRPVDEYIEFISAIKARGGLSQKEIGELKQRAFYIHAETILRHVQIV